jgi:hypothetical protein
VHNPKQSTRGPLLWLMAGNTTHTTFNKLVCHMKSRVGFPFGRVQCSSTALQPYMNMCPTRVSVLLYLPTFETAHTLSEPLQFVVLVELGRADGVYGCCCPLPLWVFRIPVDANLSLSLNKGVMLQGSKHVSMGGVVRNWGVLYITASSRQATAAVSYILLTRVVKITVLGA